MAVYSKLNMMAILRNGRKRIMRVITIMIMMSSMVM
jgi:hypothetical protein